MRPWDFFRKQAHESKNLGRATYAPAEGTVDPIERADIDLAQAQIEEETLLERQKELKRQLALIEKKLLKQARVVRGAKRLVDAYQKGWP